MSTYSLLPENHPLLRSVARSVEYSEEIADLIEGMKETMEGAGGIGLAAPQIGVGLRVIVVKDIRGVARGWCNPEILSSEGAVEFLEGCLSLPNKKFTKKRKSKLKLRAINEKGVPEVFFAEGLEAICFQHEIDHLNGILIDQFVDS